MIWASYESAVLVTLEELVTLRPSSGVGIFICGKKWGLSSPQLHGPCLWPINMSSVAEIYISSGEVYFCACLFKIVGFLICTACRNEIQINQKKNHFGQIIAKYISMGYVSVIGLKCILCLYILYMVLNVNQLLKSNILKVTKIKSEMPKHKSTYKHSRICHQSPRICSIITFLITSGICCLFTLIIYRDIRKIGSKNANIV